MPAASTACPLDCPDACSLDVKVEEGRVVEIDGNHANPVTAGFICAKVREFGKHLYGPGRLLHPAVREGAKGEGRFRDVSWDEALDLIASRLAAVREESGGEAILPFYYGGSNGFVSQGSADFRFFRRLGASRLTRTVCAAPTSAAATGLYGKMPGVSFQDYVHARLVILWGVNPSASGIHLVPYVREAMRAGAKLVVVDPRRTKLAAQADMHVAPRPGTDLPLALAVIHRLFEGGHADDKFLSAHATGVAELRERASAWSVDRASEVSGVPASQIDQLADWYAGASPAVLRCGWGLERNRNGGSAAAAVLALPAVAGKFGVRGGGYTMTNSAAWTVNAAAAIREEEPSTRIVNMNLLGRELLEASDPPIRALFVYNSNVLATNPAQEKVRRGLQREDLFTVVFDQQMTDTARYADVLLPATTFLEHEELSRGYGAYAFHDIHPAANPAGESRSNVQVFTDLCRRLGLERPGDPGTAGEIKAALLSGPGEWLRSPLSRGEVAAPRFGRTPIQFVDVFPETAGAKAHLFPPELDAEAPEGLYAFLDDPATAEFPLALISPSTEKTISSTLGQLNRKQVPIEIHPADAAARGIGDGDVVRVFNELGSVTCHARVTDAVRPGVTSLPKGLWSHNVLGASTANALAPDTLTDLGGGACFNDSRVQVERSGA